MKPKPNAYGVYLEAETFILPRAVKGWRGASVANIRVLNVGDHWIWATDFHLWTGDHAGSCCPLMDRAGRRAPSREAAIDAASAHLRELLINRETTYPDARAIIAWLPTLFPVQMDLFGAAA